LRQSWNLDAGKEGAADYSHDDCKQPQGMRLAAHCGQGGDGVAYALIGSEQAELDDTAARAIR